MSKPRSRRPNRFPLKISYEVGVLTLVTFAISVFTLAWQILNYLQGADVKLIAPDQIIIGSSERVGFPSRDGGPYVHFVVRMSYVNAAAAGYNATIRRERIQIRMQGHPGFEYRWYRFVTSDATGTDGTTLTVEKVSDARPFPLNAGTSESHATLFQPWPKQCTDLERSCRAADNYIEWDKFIELVRASKSLEIELSAESYGIADTVAIKCKIELNDRAIDNLAMRRWGSPVCR